MGRSGGCPTRMSRFPRKHLSFPMGSLWDLWVFTRDIGYPPLELSFCRDWFGVGSKGLFWEKMQEILPETHSRFHGNGRFTIIYLYMNGWCLWSFMQINMPFWWMPWVSKDRNCRKFSFWGVVNGLKVGETRGPPKRLGKQKLTSHTVKQTNSN